MKQYLITSADGIDAMELRDVETPKPKSDEILVKMRANSLNYRDLIITMGGYTLSDTCPVVPVSDGAGDVVEVGSDVTDFAVGDKVVGNFIRDWTKGMLHVQKAPVLLAVALMAPWHSMSPLNKMPLSISLII